MKIFGQTDIGLVRFSNQDSFRVGEFESGTVWAVLCDGMGGASGGDIASKMAVELIALRINEYYNDKMKTSSVANLLESAINFANIRIYDMAKEDETLSGMGTTVVAAIARENEVMISHAGDSRAYAVSDNTVNQLTKDHSVVQSLIESGKIGDVVSMRAQFTCWYPDMPGVWRQTKAKSGGGAVVDMATHCIDLLHHLSGTKAEEVFAFCSTHSPFSII